MRAIVQHVVLAFTVFSAATCLTVHSAAQKSAPTAAWSAGVAISPVSQPDPTRGSQLNDVAVNASGLTLAAWDQFTYNNGGAYSIGAAIQSGGKWTVPFTISGTTGFSMNPRVAVGAEGTMAVSWSYQDAKGTAKAQVAVKRPGWSTWRTYTLATFVPGGVAIARFVPVGIDAAGNLTAAWNVWNGARNVVQSATLPNGSGAWSETTTISGTEDDGLFFSLAVNARGDAAVAYSLSPYSGYANGTWAEYAFRAGVNGAWTTPVQVSETISSSVGYVTSPQVALDASGSATVTYLGYGVEAARQLGNGAFAAPVTVIPAPNAVSSFQSVDLGLDDYGNAIVAASIFDATINVDRASVWVVRGNSAGVWTGATRITDPTVPVDAYTTRVAVSNDGALALVGWIDHYHGTVQVSRSSGSTWGPADTIGRGTAFSSFQEVLGLRAGSGTIARAIWKNTKSGTQTIASSYR